jgi:predicted RNase H-like nuclease
MAVLGVDACKAGWVGIRLDDAAAPAAFCASTIEDLVALAGPLDVVGIDIPIGLPPEGVRQAEALARALVGRRSSSVFTVPPRAVLEAATHAEASARCHTLTGLGVTRQAFALGPKIHQVDDWLGRSATRVVEVHPEVSFATLAGCVLVEPKSTWAGFHLRRRLLTDAGIVLDGDMGLAGQRVGVDDVLDAAVVAWTALRVVRGEAFSLPDPPEVVDGAVMAAIWS